MFDSELIVETSPCLLYLNPRRVSEKKNKGFGIKKFALQLNMSEYCVMKCAVLRFTGVPVIKVKIFQRMQVQLKY